MYILAIDCPESANSGSCCLLKKLAAAKSQGRQAWLFSIIGHIRLDANIWPRTNLHVNSMLITQSSLCTSLWGTLTNDCTRVSGLIVVWATIRWSNCLIAPPRNRGQLFVCLWKQTSHLDLKENITDQSYLIVINKLYWSVPEQNRILASLCRSTE